MTPFVPATRLDGLGTTIFSEMTALAVRTGAINLGQGFPDTDGPQAVIEAAVAALRGGENRYAPLPGVAPLREAVLDHQRRFYGLEPEDVLVTLRPPEFRLDPDALRSAIGPRARVLLLNSPHNPTGRVLGATELEAVAHACVEHGLVCVSDEVYEHLVYDGRHVPPATLPGMGERTLTVSSVGKSFSFTGWKVGWCSGPAALVAAARTVKQYLTFAGGTPLQHAAAAALRLPAAAHLDVLRADLKARRDQLCAALSAAGLNPLRPAGTYFVNADVGCDAVEFCSTLPQRCGVAAIPTSVFYDDKAAARTLVRFAFCKREQVIAEAASRLGVLAER
jgi:N-succinyldiaminopimelate aminotransferase